MRFMISGGGGFLMCEEKVPVCLCCHERNTSHSKSFWLERPGWHPERSAGLGQGLGLGQG